MSGRPDFLTKYLPRSQSIKRPHITLTWAQSLDAKIAGEGGKRVILSGPESMLMTHWMRSMHDAILIGINTLVLDDPRLQINLLPKNAGLHTPQSIILDPKLRFPLKSRILSEWNGPNGKKGIAKQPWLICGDNVDKSRRQEVENAGARAVAVPLQNGRISPSDLPAILSSLSISSVMIEGGSSILSSFLHSPPRGDGSPLVDSIVVTVAPTFIGTGIGVVPDMEDMGLPPLKSLHTETMGKDSVMVCEIQHKS